MCGSDGLTYITPCALNEQSVLRDSSPDLPQLSMEYWGPCVEPPTIVSPPSDTYGPMGANLTLDCEARGYPAPIISWQYETVEGETIYLPSDDQEWIVDIGSLLISSVQAYFRSNCNMCNILKHP